ncbi:MAG: hypothetical protein M3Q47_05380 [Actinomycetota bacterium]|nr:hypothetical protein [Actinomycetota bacterium]
MADDELGLYLGGDLESMDARALSVGLQVLIDLLGTPPGAGKSETIWSLSRLERGSAAVSVRPGGARTQESVDRFRVIIRGVEQLELAPGEPEGWAPTDLDQLLKLRPVTSMPGVRLAALTLNGTGRQVDLRAGILDNAAASLAEEYVSIGSVRGHLDRYNGRGPRPTVGLRDELTGRSVTITFPADRRSEVLAHLERDVVVWGEIRRNSEGRPVSVMAEGIEPLERQPAEPIEALRGLFGRDWTSGRNSTTFVQEQRGG